MHLGMKGPHSEKGDGHREPCVPDYNMEAYLKREEPFTAGSSIAVMVGSEGQGD